VTIGDSLLKWRRIASIMPEIETARLHLRKLRLSDLDELALIYQDPEVMRYRLFPSPASKAATQQILQKMLDHWEQYGFGRWATVEKSSQHFIGHAGLEVIPLLNDIEINYLLARSHWNQGLATEAATAIATYGFTVLGCDRLVALAKPDNTASRCVMEKIGMHYKTDIELYGMNWVYYSLNRDQWKFNNNGSDD
jgi:ribosomal-protein-alanine N-acetyltransferase